MTTCGICGRIADYYSGGYRCGVCMGFVDLADTAEPVTPQAGIVDAEPDRDDGHTMGHD